MPRSLYQRVFQIAEYTEKSLTGKNSNLCLALICLLKVYYYDTIVSDTCVARHIRPTDSYFFLNCEVFFVFVSPYLLLVKMACLYYRPI